MTDDASVPVAADATGFGNDSVATGAIAHESRPATDLLGGTVARSRAGACAPQRVHDPVEFRPVTSTASDGSTRLLLPS